MPTSLRLVHKSFVAVAVAFAAVVAFGDSATNPTSGHWGSPSSIEQLRRYGTATRFEGNVLAMDDLAPSDGCPHCVQLRIRAANGDDVVVHLGPRWFVLQNDFTVTRGEPISIVGVSIRLEGKPTIVADRVKTKSRELLLRDEGGKPRWAGGRPKD